MGTSDDNASSLPVFGGCSGLFCHTIYSDCEHQNQKVYFMPSPSAFRMTTSAYMITGMLSASGRFPSKIVFTQECGAKKYMWERTVFEVWEPLKNSHFQRYFRL